MTGKVAVQFSDKFFVPSNTTAIKDLGQLTVNVQPVEDQAVEHVAFDWSVSSFSKTELELTLIFEQPHKISAREVPNMLEIGVADPNLFIRIKDGHSVQN